MYTSDYVGAIQKAGIHFDRVISECTFIAWDSARSAPFAGADYIVAVDRRSRGRSRSHQSPRPHQRSRSFALLGKPEVTIYRGSRQ